MDLLTNTPRSKSQSVPVLAIEAQPGCCQHHAPTFHPAITAADRATMSVRELAFFTDDPVAHAVAYRDYIRARQIETRNAEIAEYLERRGMCIGAGEN